MLTPVQWLFLIGILLAALAGGYVPLFCPARVRQEEGLPRGQAFAAGVFLGLCLTILLPAGTNLFRQALPDVHYPLASSVGIFAFLCLLALEHKLSHLMFESQQTGHDVRSPAIIPLVMTLMIAIPSFFLGATLGMSNVADASLLFVAIMIHKSSAAFALSLKMVQSTLTHRKTLLTFGLFACATPLGILVGGDLSVLIASQNMLVVKGTVMSLGAGTFLYMGTVHEMRHASLIEHCATKDGFLAMVTGLIVTALARFLLGQAHFT